MGAGHGGDLPDHLGARSTCSFGKHVAVLTDARFSGVSTGACIGHVGPEALAGGPIGKVRDGDLIRIVIDRDRLEGTIDLVGDGERRVRPRARAPASWPSARRAPTSRPTPTSPTTPGSGPPCRPSAAAPGAAASTTPTPSSSRLEASRATVAGVEPIPSRR